jgi:hypothetical protein
VHLNVWLFTVTFYPSVCVRVYAYAFLPTVMCGLVFEYVVGQSSPPALLPSRLQDGAGDAAHRKSAYLAWTRLWVRSHSKRGEDLCGAQSRTPFSSSLALSCDNVAKIPELSGSAPSQTPESSGGTQSHI